MLSAAVRWTGNGEESGSQSGGAALQESIPDEDNFSPGSRSSQHDPPVKALGVFEPVLEIIRSPPSPKLLRRVFLFLSQGSTPVPGLPRANTIPGTSA